MKRLLAIALTTGLFASSCRSDVELDVPGESPKIVVNGVLRQDSVFRVLLSESRFILDITPRALIEDGSLRLFENGVEKGSWAYVGEGVYEAQGVIPVSGNRYQLQVNAPGLAEVSAEGVVPSPMDQAKILSIDSTRIEHEKKVRVRIQLSDPADTEDYYVIHRIVKGIGFDGQTETTIYAYSQLTSETAAVFSSCGEDYGFDNAGCKVLFNDRAFQGSEREIMVSYTQFFWDENSKEESYLVVSRVTREYYDYMLSLYHNGLTEDNPFAEPVSIAMNVSGGYGILGAASSKWFYIR